MTVLELSGASVAPIVTLSFAPGGKLLAIGTRGTMAAVTVWDIAEERQVGGLMVTKNGFGPTARGLPVATAFLNDGQLAVVAATGHISLGDPTDASRTLLQVAAGSVAEAAAIEPSGETVIVAGPQQMRRVRLGASGPEWVFNARPGTVFGGLARAPDGRLVVAVNPAPPIDPNTPPTGELYKVEPDTGRLTDSLATTAGRVDALAWSPRGDRLVGRIGQRLWLWDATTGAAIGPLAAGGTGLFTSAAFHPSGRWVLAGAPNVDGAVFTWDADTGAEVQSDVLPIGPVHAVAISSDGKLAAAGGESGRTAVWEWKL